MKQSAVLIDCDRTLMDGRDRWFRFDKGLITEEQLYSYEEAIKDLIVPGIERLILDLQPWNEIIILTARHKDRDEKVTLDWLNKHRIPYSLLVMDETNEKSAAEFKVEAYNKLKEKYDIWLVVDDDDKVVKAFREAGLQCLQTDYVK